MGPLYTIHPTVFNKARAIIAQNWEAAEDPVTNRPLISLPKALRKEIPLLLILFIIPFWYLFYRKLERAEPKIKSAKKKLPS